MFLALASPFAAYDTTLFSVHMGQHLLLTLVAAPLLLLGAPVSLLVRASPDARRLVAGLVHRPAVRTLTSPVVTWTLFGIVMWFSHYSALYNAALDSDVVHLGEHALYLAAGLLFWWPVVGIDPGARRLKFPARLVYVILEMPVQAFLALAIYSADRVLYPNYANLVRAWGPSPLDDQRGAAVVMWVGGDFLFLAALVLLLFAWMRADEREAAHIDRRLGTA